MKRPEDMDEATQKVREAVKRWLQEEDPVQRKDSTFINYAGRFSAFTQGLWKAEVAKQLELWGWAVVSFNYNDVEVKPK